MTDSEKDVKFSLKAVINRERTKVLFAEIDSNFADVLLGFLSLPLGTIIRAMDKHFGNEAPVIGSITTLYNGLSNLDSALFWTEGGKQMLLNPVSSLGCEGRKLKFAISGTQPTKYFSCENWDCTASRCIGMYNDANRCSCGKQLKKEIPVHNFDGDIAFTVSTATFIITDELQIMPNLTTSVLQIQSDLGIADLGGTELRNVSFGFDKIMDLLKVSLLSETPLTDLVLKGQAKFKMGVPFSPIEKRGTSNNSSKCFRERLKVILHKSTKKFLFAEAEEDFIEFLFSFLTIPLGAVEYLLERNTGLKNIDNMYRSIAGLTNYMHVRTQGIYCLIKPMIPHGYIYQNIFNLSEKSAPLLMYDRSVSEKTEHMYKTHTIPGFSVRDAKNYTLVIPKGKCVYVRGPRSYMVKDDLTVTPMCITSHLSTLSELKISLSDVEERLLDVGLEEALSILKASLTSTSAISNGLHHLLKKELKQEQ